MVQIEHVIAAVAATIAFCSLMIAVATLWGNAKKSSGKQDAHNAHVETSLNNIAEDVKDIKAEHRSLRADVTEAKQMALHATERAEAAHKRIDRSGIDAHD